jgi:hypothetical protein
MARTTRTTPAQQPKIHVREGGSVLEEHFPAFSFDPETGEEVEFDPASLTQEDTPDAQGILGRMRLSLGAIGCDASKAAEDFQTHPLAIIISQVHAVIEKKNPRAGEKDQPETFLALAGYHEAMNTQPGSRFYGKRFRSNMLYLPSDLNDQFAEAFHRITGSEARRARPGEWRGIEFAMQLFSEPAPKSKAGFSYYWRPLTKTGLPDPLAALRHETMQLLAVEKRLKELPRRPAQGEPDPMEVSEREGRDL